MIAFLHRFLNVRRHEVGPLVVAAIYYFCVLTALMILRPARDALGMRRDMDEIRWLFVGTAVVTLAVNPAFGWLVSRFRRTTFIAATYGFFAISLVGFYALLTLTPQAVGEVSGMVFYVWFSVFNLFCTMVFWALMADSFVLEQSKRLFGVIAVGGTLGAIAGPWLASMLARPLGTPALLLIGVVFLCLAMASAWRLARTPAVRMPPRPHEPRPAQTQQSIIGGNAWKGLSAVLRSPYLLGISTYMLLLSVIATFIYFTRMQMVRDLGGDTDSRAAILAQIDLATQLTTLFLQVIATGHIMKRFGVTVALMLLPVLIAFGFLGLALVGSFAVMVALDVTFKAIQRAVLRPARETLFTVVSREDKYKSKSVTDTFVYRGGDMLGAGIEGMLSKLGMATLGVVAIPLALVWALIGGWLGRRQNALASRAARSKHEPSAAATRV